jgi:glycosyltransferase involved in cell wall biosynthesis
VICVSENHARRHGTIAFVHNGVRLDEYEFRADKDDFDLFLARLHSAKGWRVAVAAAKTAKFRLVVAGGWRPSLSRWVRFVGEVGGERKRELLAAARCLWMPVQWDDPCPVNVLEALASGTPVLATPRGSLAELVGPDGGGIADSLDGLLALRRNLAQFDAQACRRRAERYFTHLRMARDYVRMYEGLLANSHLPAGRRADAAG